MTASVPPASIISASPRQDHLGRLADGVAAGGAGAHGREVGTLRAEAHGHLARRHVGDGHGDEERAEAVGAARGADADLVDERAAAAEAGADQHAGLLGRGALQARGQAGVVHRLARRDQGELRGAVVAADLLAVEHAAGVEVLDLAGHPAGDALGIEGRDAPHAGLAGHQPLPERRHVVAERRDRAHARDDDAAAPGHGFKLAHRMNRPVRIVAAR